MRRARRGGPRPPGSPARASLVVDTLEAGGAAAPWTCSAVALGAVGVAPALGLGWIERRLAHALRPGGACEGRPEMVALPSGGLQRARRSSPPLRRALAPLVAVVALAACYVGAVRRAAPPSEDGPFVACDDDAAAAATATSVELGGRLTVFSVLYGRRTLRVPAASSVACRRGGGRGIVVAADGSQRVEILRRCEFDHVSMTMSVVARLADGGLRCFCKGAPEALAKRCDPASLPADYAAIAAAHALQGYYVLGLAAKEPGPLSEVS